MFPGEDELAVAESTGLPASLAGLGIEADEHTIIEAFVLVVIIIFLFLRDWRSTLIPVVAIPVSLVGIFFVTSQSVFMRHE